MDRYIFDGILKGYIKVIRISDLNCVLIEDDVLVRQVLTTILTSEGFNVIGFDSLTSFWDEVEDDVQFFSERDIIIVDMNLHQEENGLDFINTIRDEFQFTRSILISGNNMDHYSGYKLAKPFDKDQLLDKIAEVVENN